MLKEMNQRMKSHNEGSGTGIQGHSKVVGTGPEKRDGGERMIFDQNHWRIQEPVEEEEETQEAGKERWWRNEHSQPIFG